MHPEFISIECKRHFWRTSSIGVTISFCFKRPKEREREREITLWYCSKLLLGHCVISFYLRSPHAFLLYAELSVEQMLGGKGAGSAGGSLSLRGNPVRIWRGAFSF